MRCYYQAISGVGVVVVNLALMTISIQLALAIAVAAGSVRRPTTTAVPAVYVFGDSILDVGNNNYLPGADVPRANMPYYGVDFPGGGARPTGRFSNGYNVADFIAKAMGFKRSPPAYLSLTPRSSRLIVRGIGGVNYASGGAGILDSTLAGKSIPLSKQVLNFGATRAHIVASLGSTTANHLLSKSLFLIAVGTNDMAAFATTTQTQQQISDGVAAFYSSLISNYSKTITELYGMGARKFCVINVGQIGCAPLVRAAQQSPTGACSDAMNALAAGFDVALRSLMARLGQRLHGVAYSLGDLYGLMQATIADPAGAAGLSNVDAACCGGGRLGAQSGCWPNSTVCADRRSYLFWDYGHPTQRVAELIASAFYDGPAQFTTPVNLKQLVRPSGSSAPNGDD